MPRKVWIPAYAGMTVNAYAGMTVNAYAGMTVNAFAGMTVNAYAGMTVNAFARMTAVVPAKAGIHVRKFLGISLANTSEISAQFTPKFCQVSTNVEYRPHFAALHGQSVKRLVPDTRYLLKVVY